jgi:uncharacterized lipoprotein YmbA
MNYSAHLRNIGFFVLFLLLVSGCGTTPASRFYTLTPADSTTFSSDPAQQQHSIIAIGPIKIPEYLDRPQIVIRASNSELIPAEFHRWGGSLDNDLKRIIPQNITQQLISTGYLALSWPVSARGDLPIQYRVVIDILQFDGNPDGMVVLKSQWWILRNDEKVLKTVHNSLITVKVQGQDYEHLVTAMSNAVFRLSSEIADIILTLPTGEKPKPSK